MARRIRIVKKTIAMRQSLPDVSVSKETPVLRVLCQFDGFLSEILCQASVVAGLRGLADAFFDTRVFDHAMQ